MSPFKFNPDLLIIHRKSCNFTQTKVGELVGVNKMTISKWERGITTPSSRNITKLAQVLRTKPKRLLLLDFAERSKELCGK